MTVLIKKGNNASVYHKDSGDGTPCCLVNYNDQDVWYEWPVEKAEVWREPCQNPKCYGSKREFTSGSAGPV